MLSYIPPEIARESWPGARPIMTPPVTIHFMQLTGEQVVVLLSIARNAIRRTLENQRLEPPTTHFSILQQPAGCFVSLHNLHPRELRGCVGRILSPDPLITTCQESAVAVLNDPRFKNWRITRGQLHLLDIEISVMSPLREVSSPTDFDPQNEGIFLACEGRTGCFLPQVARETGWDRQTLLNKLCSEKLQLPENAWADSRARLSTFTTFIIGPEPFEPN
jgi:uncharacterized protein